MPVKPRKECAMNKMSGSGIPFAIDRGSSEGITEQVVNGFICPASR